MHTSQATRWVGYVFLALVTLSVFWPIGDPLAAGIYAAYVTPGVYLSDIGIALLLACLVVGKFDLGKLRRFPFVPHLLALSVLAIVTVPFALTPRLALYTAFRWLLALFLYVSLVLLALPVRRVASIFVLTAGIHALIGLAQFLSRAPLGLPGEMALALDQFGTSSVPVFGTRWLRAYGLTFNPNVLGGLLTVGLLIGIPLLVRLRWRAVWVFLWVGLLLSFSRSAWLAAVLTVFPTAGLLAWKHRTLRRPLLKSFGMLVGFGVPAFAVFGPTILTRLRPNATVQEWVSLLGRFELWKVALGVIKERPLTGIGAGNFPLAVSLTDTIFLPDHAHNVPLHLAAEVGVLGAAIWLLMCIMVGVTLVRRNRSLSTWVIVWLSAWLALGIISLFDGYPWMLNAGRLLSVSVLAMSSVSQRKLEG